MSMKAESLRAQMPTSRATPTESPDLAALFDGHIAREFADQDVDATMETMVPEPYVHCVAIMTGGFGHEGVRRFYSEHFINQIPKDVTVTPISRTVGRTALSTSSSSVSLTTHNGIICCQESRPRANEWNFRMWWS